MFDRVVVGVSSAFGKTGVLPAEKRVALIGRCLKNIGNAEAVGFDGLLVDFCRAAGARVIVRGVRNGADFTYENAMLYVNRTLAPDIETVYILPDSSLCHISASIVRELISLNADIGAFVPNEIADELRRLYK
jgi:pantetheine-phosphate adenylyltransferase